MGRRESMAMENSITVPTMHHVGSADDEFNSHNHAVKPTVKEFTAGPAGTPPPQERVDSSSQRKHAKRESALDDVDSLRSLASDEEGEEEAPDEEGAEEKATSAPEEGE